MCLAYFGLNFWKDWLGKIADPLHVYIYSLVFQIIIFENKTRQYCP